MPPRQTHDPFTDAPLRQNNSHATSGTTSSILRGQTSQNSLRSNASTASARPRQPRDLFAPSLSRRPTSRTTPRVEDEVLADPDSEEELLAIQRQRHVKRGSPEAKHARLRPRQVEEQDIVNRRADGSYLMGIFGEGHNGGLGAMTTELQAEEEQKNLDAHYAAVGRHYFTSGAALGGRGGRKQEEEFENMALPMSMRLREQAMRKIEDERWMFEPSDRFQTRLR